MRVQFLELPIQNGIWHGLELTIIELHAPLDFVLSVVFLPNPRPRCGIMAPLPVLRQPLEMLQCRKDLEFYILLLRPSL